MEIVLATHNLHKLREFRDIFRVLPGLELLSLKNFADFTLPEETEATFFGNAALKAQAAAKKLQKWVVADDSGLVVPALEGAPGVISARWAGVGATDRENRKKLLSEMKKLKGLQRAAYFECCLVLAAPNGEIKKSVTGICEGLVLEEERGNNGFGYDPLFIKHDYDKSFAELDESTKNRISHRAKAFQKLLPTLEGLLKEDSRV
jgi:XTP/dITP diphosphohydrolase